MNAEFFLSWPNKLLSPNARPHWSTLAKAKKAAKLEAFTAVKAARIPMLKVDAVKVKYTFFPPDRRARDLDNLAAQTKAASDGIRDAIGVDDSKFEIAFSKANPIEKRGMVKVELEWKE